MDQVKIHQLVYVHVNVLKKRTVK